MDNNEHMFEDETTENTSEHSGNTYGDNGTNNNPYRNQSNPYGSNQGSVNGNRMAIHMEILTEMPVRITETLMEAVDRITSIPTIAIHIPTGRPDRRWDQMARNWV